jgi:hypothetical protein
VKQGKEGSTQFAYVVLSAEDVGAAIAIQMFSPLKIKINSKNMREKPTNTPIIHSVY